MIPLEVKPIPVGSDDHPEPPHFALPKHEFTWGFIAPPGSGKTTLLCNLLLMYKGYFNKIKVFSPTVLSDEKWDYIKKQKLLVENKPLKEWVEKKMEEENATDVVSERPISKEMQVAKEDEFTPYLTDEDFYDDYQDFEFRELMTEQKGVIDMLKGYDKPKFLADRLLVIFDDLVGSPLFKGQKGNYFTGVTTRHRHHGASFMVVSQGYKEIPKTIRTALMCLSVFEIGNEQELKVIYEEFGMGLKWADWMEVYENAVDGDDYGFMFFNYQKPRGMRMMRKFDKFLMVKE
tara:strand:+ start:3697 stop:4566 length:870 start_codon:yes stop_codon:yes gene_type:complete